MLFRYTLALVLILLIGVCAWGYSRFTVTADDTFRMPVMAPKTADPVLGKLKPGTFEILLQVARTAVSTNRLEQFSYSKTQNTINWRGYLEVRVGKQVIVLTNASLTPWFETANGIHYRMGSFGVTHRETLEIKPPQGIAPISGIDLVQAYYVIAPSQDTVEVAWLRRFTYKAVIILCAVVLSCLVCLEWKRLLRAKNAGK